MAQDVVGAPVRRVEREVPDRRGIERLGDRLRLGGGDALRGRRWTGRAALRRGLPAVTRLAHEVGRGGAVSGERRAQVRAIAGQRRGSREDRRRREVEDGVDVELGEGRLGLGCHTEKGPWRLVQDLAEFRLPEFRANRPRPVVHDRPPFACVACVACVAEPRGCTRPTVNHVGVIAAFRRSRPVAWRGVVGWPSAHPAAPDPIPSRGTTPLEDATMTDQPTPETTEDAAADGQPDAVIGLVTDGAYARHRRRLLEHDRRRGGVRPARRRSSATARSASMAWSSRAATPRARSTSARSPTTAPRPASSGAWSVAWRSACSSRRP